MVALACLCGHVATSVAQDKNPEDRITATFYQAQGTAQRSKAAATPPDKLVGAFKVDPEAPIHIEADRLVEVIEGPMLTSSAVLTGIVKLQQGDFQLRTVSLTAFYSGQSSFSTGGEWRSEQLTRVEAKERVFVIAKDGQTVTANWATFDVLANTMLMGDDVTVSLGKDVAQGREGHSLKIDLTTGMYRFEIASPHPPTPQMRPQ
jgi:lipopolysaccharide export system protein LptA